MELSFAELAFHRADLLRRHSGSQNILAVLSQPRKNLCQMWRSLSRTEDDFGHAHAQGAVVIYVGETQVFERQMPQLLHRFVRRELAALHLVEEFLDGFGVHGGAVSSFRFRVSSTTRNTMVR